MDATADKQTTTRQAEHRGRVDAKLILSHRPALARERVMHIGEAVAMVIAETALAAQDAGEFVDIHYEPLTAITDARDALKPGAPQLWPDAPGNLAVDWPGPAADPDANAAEGERIFASAKHVARIAEMNQRLVVASMEPRGATASHDAAKDSYLMRTCSPGAGAVGANIPTFNFTRCLPGMYDIRHIDVATKCVYTNTIPTAPYRGAGRPEANYVLERLVDEAARVTGIDPVKLRRRNLIRPSAIPYKTAVGTTYDS